ncbi:hypothetical protein AAFF_G00368340 [Aldrovandia affinis]|uniref:Uncharacterized protein n=1 Tax=Aldrovandia affinis TaxID=143900 RepID=A0AAD7WMP1_9TELE|nr:hypothetical protein AAFF_G00368340 [Aldrovandia affinis]
MTFPLFWPSPISRQLWFVFSISEGAFQTDVSWLPAAPEDLGVTAWRSTPSGQRGLNLKPRKDSSLLTKNLLYHLNLVNSFFQHGWVGEANLLSQPLRGSTLNEGFLYKHEPHLLNIE